MEDKRSYYAIIPANVRYDKTLPSSAKLLYGEISALCNQHGFCWAENCYFADLYNVSDRTIQVWINALANGGYIYRNFLSTDDGKNTSKRCLSIVSMSPDFVGGRDFLRGGYEENFVGGMKISSPIILQDNNTMNNFTNRKVDGVKFEKVFRKPTIEEIRAYCEERKNTVDAQQFWDFYQSKGWKVGNQSMKDWKAAVRTWEQRRIATRPIQQENLYKDEEIW